MRHYILTLIAVCAITFIQASDRYEIFIQNNTQYPLTLQEITHTNREDMAPKDIIPAKKTVGLFPSAHTQRYYLTYQGYVGTYKVNIIPPTGFMFGDKKRIKYIVNETYTGFDLKGPIEIYSIKPEQPKKTDIARGSDLPYKVTESLQTLELTKGVLSTDYAESSIEDAYQARLKRIQEQIADRRRASYLEAEALYAYNVLTEYLNKLRK